MAESVEMVENKGKPPVFCEKFCIVCKGAREGNNICKAIQNIELKIFGKNGSFGELQGQNITELLLIKNSLGIQEKIGSVEILYKMPA